MMIGKGLTALCVLAISVPTVAAETTSKPAANAKDPNAVRCKSEPVTGSLVRAKKICKTNAEWEALAESGNRDAREMMQIRSCAGPLCSGS